MHFNEDWYPPAKQQRLRQAIAATPRISGAIVEIGCWEGRSTIVIANEFEPEIVHCVDHWRGDLTDPNSGVAVKAAERDVHSQFQTNMQKSTAGNYVTHRSDWRLWADNWTEPIRFIHLDAQHTFDEVTDQLRWAATSLAEIAVVCGDDFNQAAVGEAVMNHTGLDRRQLRLRGPGNNNFWATIVRESQYLPLSDGQAHNPRATH